MCRPGVNQRVLYNRHKRVHSIKFQSVALPNGHGHLYGPVEGRRHDSSMLASSGLLQELQRFFNSLITGTPMCLYGDPAYPLRVHLQGPFRGAALAQDQKKLQDSHAMVNELLLNGFLETLLQISGFQKEPQSCFKCSGENVH